MEKVHKSKISRYEVEKMRNRFKNSTDKERKSINGLQAKRSDIIAAGTEILVCIMDSLNIKEVIISEYDNLEGMIYTKI